MKVGRWIAVAVVVVYKDWQIAVLDMDLPQSLLSFQKCTQLKMTAVMKVMLAGIVRVMMKKLKKVGGRPGQPKRLEVVVGPEV